MIEFHKLVRQLREERGMTATAAAEASGIKVAFWSDMEAGRKRPSAETAEQMRTVLKPADEREWHMSLLYRKIGEDAINVVMRAVLDDVLAWAHEQSNAAQAEETRLYLHGGRGDVQWHAGARHMADGLATWAAERRPV